MGRQALCSGGSGGRLTRLFGQLDQSRNQQNDGDASLRERRCFVIRRPRVQLARKARDMRKYPYTGNRAQHGQENARPLFPTAFPSDEKSPHLPTLRFMHRMKDMSAGGHAP